MADFNPLSYAFWANEPAGSTPSSVQALRQRMALALMAQKRKYPTNFGEGLAAIGDALGDVGIMRRLEAEARASSAQEDKQIQDQNKALTPGAISSSAIAPTDETAAAEPSTAPATPVAAAAPADAADPWTARSAAVSGIESGGKKNPYTMLHAVTPSGDRAYGKYGIMGNNIPSWTQAALGRAMTPQQFVANTPEAQQAQDTTFRHRFGQYVDKYGEEGAARAWYAGEGGMKNLGATDLHGRLTVAGYGQDYLNRLRGAGGGRDAVAAAAMTPPQQPPGPTDMMSEARFNDVVGMGRGPTGAFSYAPTASRTGDVMTDAPPITGVSPAVGAAAGDTVQQRQEMLQPPQGATPQVGPQIAQAPQQGPFPPVAADVKPIIPGGGFPQVMPQQAPIPQAPPDPRTAIQPMPAPKQQDEYVPRERPRPQPPTKPGPGPIEQRLTPTLSSDVGQRVKDNALRLIQQEQTVRNAQYENLQKNYEIDAKDWLKEQELNQQYKQGLPKQREDVAASAATREKTGLESQNIRTEQGFLQQRLQQEQAERAAKVGSAQAKAEIEQSNAEFQRRTGREREPFLKEFAGEKAATTSTVNLLNSAARAKEAVESGFVISGWGGEKKLELAKIAAAFNLKDAAQVAAKSEQYKTASDQALNYAVQLFQGKDPRVTDADIRQAQGQLGTLDKQRESQLKIINIMQEDAHKKINNYEDMRDFYLRGDPQHRFFKVDTPPVGREMRDLLLQNQQDPRFVNEFNKQYGPGAAELEIARAKRRMQREDD